MLIQVVPLAIDPPPQGQVNDFVHLTIQPATDAATIEVIRWGVLGPSGRVWTFPGETDIAPWLTAEAAAREFAEGSGWPLVRSVDGQDWRADL